MSGELTKNIIVKADVDKVYSMWANFENFPNFMKYIRRVKKTGERTSHWEVSGPLGVNLEWNAEVTRMDENKRIAWSTKDDDKGDVTTSGQVTFNALPQGETEISATIKYEPRTSRAGEVLEKILHNPEKRLEEDLRNFKAYAEGMYDRTP
ncbi:MAG: SRPBCC family protein [Anaerolineales bacterium]|jgi:uncharacterized membrane protein